MGFNSAFKGLKLLKNPGNGRLNNLNNLVLNVLIRKTVRGVKVLMALSNLSLGKTFIACLVGRSFATECLCMKHQTLLLRTIHSAAEAAICFNVSLL